MTDPGPFDEDNPFANLPFFGDLAKMFQQTGAVNWDAARQFARMLASGGQAEQNVDPVLRSRVEELARIAELHVARATGLDLGPGGGAPRVTALSRSEWALRTLDAYRPLMERLAGRLGTGGLPPEAADSPEAQFLGGIFQFLNPMMMAMSAGSMAGHLSQVSLGQYDLPIPREGDEIALVGRNVVEFAEQWSIDVDDVALWLCLHELTLHAVLSRPHVRAAVLSLLEEYIDGFRSDPRAFEDKLSGLELGSGDPAELQQQLQEVLGDPDAILGAMRSDAQAEVVPRLEAVLATIVGYVDHIIDEVSEGLITSADQLGEAFRRRRVTASASDRFVERLLGVEFRPEIVEQGNAFVAGVRERAGDEGLRRLWAEPDNLPTPNEVAAPGLWLARIDLSFD